MIKYCYTLKDVLNLVTSPITYDSDKIVTMLRDSLSSESTELNSVLSLHNISFNDMLRMKMNTEQQVVINSTPYSKLLNLIKFRLGSDYIIKCEKEIESPFYNVKELQEWSEKFLEILFYTKDKYINILNIYEDNISKLMNPLKTNHLGSGNTSRHEDYDTDMTGKNLFTETPETTDVVATMEQDQYVSELSKSSAHTDNTGDVAEARQEASETTMDSQYAMAKIKEIQDSYQMTLKKWSSEFEPLFMEEV